VEIIVDGRPVFAATGGRRFDPREPAVVLLHGAGMDHTVWALQTRYLAHHGRAVLAVDLPGHGRSGGAALATIEDMADWVGALLDAAGVAETALVGHSMGAITALEAASRAPERVRKLALLGATAAMPVNSDLLTATREAPEKAIAMIVTWAVGRPAHIGGYRAPGLWVMGGAGSLLRKAPKGVLHTDFAACDAYRNGLAAAEKVRCPTLLVIGEADLMTPARRAGELAAAIPDCRMTTIAGAGHMMMVEKPDETLDALRNFV